MKHLMLVMLVGLAQMAFGQKYFSKTGKISFVSDAPMEKIEATNTSASTVIDVATGNMEWAVLVQGFKFDKALMQEHFNENYMESGKYPKATFKGKIENISVVNFSKDGTYNVNVVGNLEVHGVSKPVTTTGTIVVNKGIVSANSTFSIKLEDHKIEIPKVVGDNVARTVDITVKADYQLLDTTR